MDPIRRLVLALALAALGTATAPVPRGAEAAPAPGADARSDFSGRWVPDFDRWRGVDTLLEIQDASWWVRRALTRVDLVEEIEQTPDSLRISVDVALPLPVKERRYRLDNRTRLERTPLGKPSHARHYWEDDSTLVHERRLSDRDGRPYVLVARRRLLDEGETMRVEIVAHLPDEKHAAVQIYQRER